MLCKYVGRCREGVLRPLEQGKQTSLETKAKHTEEWSHHCMCTPTDMFTEDSRGQGSVAKVVLRKTWSPREAFGVCHLVGCR